MARRYKPMEGLTHRAECALRKCIREKWEVLAKGEADFEPDCELCEQFITEDDFCSRCPVFHRTGEEGCVGSPYDDWKLATDVSYDLQDRRHVAAAKKELRFLKDTLRLGLKARERAT